MGIKHLSTIELNAFNHFNFLFVNRKLDLLDFYNKIIRISVYVYRQI